MEWTGLNELREKYLAFFESKGHLRLPSFPLVPQGDASLLLINSGMAPMKKYFTGEATPPCVRVATCQKCIRTVDIEVVGVTARHHSYFEMLGNFSFGEYFKREAIAWAWEFFTEVLEMDPARLYPSVFYENDGSWDSEAWDIWTKEIGVPASRMARLGRADNFWEHGAGPCGPCSEIYYDRGEQYGCGSPDCAPGCDCDRYMEVWNLVFTQFDSDGQGNYTELATKNIDTGMSLERLACVCQGAGSNFEVDAIWNIMRHVMDISGVIYHAGTKNDISLRIITDHARATVMMISDGVLPSNEGRGYVLRRLLRRAARHGRLLGIERSFLSEVAVTVIKENKNAYPVLAEKQDFILKVIANEEENFSRTIDAGLGLLGKMMEDTRSGGKNAAPTDVLSGENAFKLSDTYGFPIDLTKEILEENNMTVDEDAYRALAQQQRERSRAARKEAGGWDSDAADAFRDLPPTEFVGYEVDQCEATVLAVFDDIVVLDKTPFFAESGGQCGDYGYIHNERYFENFTVGNATKTAEGVILHHRHVMDHSDVPDSVRNDPVFIASAKAHEEMKLQVGDTVNVWVFHHHREDVRANHTAAHLLHDVLRRVLGNHVEQAGQSVTAEHLRFDFTHFAALTLQELHDVEYGINQIIRYPCTVHTEILPIEEAKLRGAMALFGEKYGDTVRMVSIRAEDITKAISVELCGGTHAKNTGELGAFYITSESSVASGVRRIEAVTGRHAYHHFFEKKLMLEKTAEILKASNDNEQLLTRAQAVMAQLKETEKALASAQEKLSSYAVQELLLNALEIGNVKFVTGELTGDLRQACDVAKQSGEAMAALFACKTDKGLQFAAASSPGAVKAGAHAGNLVRAAAGAAGGSGGGKADSAMAGGKDAAKLGEALAAGETALRAMIA